MTIDIANFVIGLVTLIIAFLTFIFYLIDRWKNKHVKYKLTSCLKTIFPVKEPPYTILECFIHVNNKTPNPISINKVSCRAKSFNKFQNINLPQNITPNNTADFSVEFLLSNPLQKIYKIQISSSVNQRRCNIRFKSDK